MRPQPYESTLVVDPFSETALSLRERFLVAGTTWEISTNSEEILTIMSGVFQPAGNESSPPDLKLWLYVDAGIPEHHGPVRRPHFRALEHLYYGTFGPGETILVDQRGRRVVGSWSPATARDLGYWKRVILPLLLGIASACMRITPVHCACVVRNQLGLLIQGESGSGKSTLALSLSLKGFSYLSDDFTYISSAESRLRCWGSTAPLKLLPEAVKYFPQLAGLTPSESLNGEIAFEVDPTEVFGVTRSSVCDPRWLIFIERTSEPKASFRAIGPSEAALCLAADLELLPACISDQRDHQLAVIDALVQRESYVMRHGLAPDAAAVAITEFCDRS